MQNQPNTVGDRVVSYVSAPPCHHSSPDIEWVRPEEGGESMTVIGANAEMLRSMGLTGDPVDLPAARRR